MHRHTVLSEDKHLQSVNHAVLKARAEWKKIGRALGLSVGIIKSIHDPDDGECLHDVLTKWIYTGKATIYDLLEALEDPTVARRDIANEIRDLKGEERSKVGLDPDTKTKPQGEIHPLIDQTRAYRHGAIGMYVSWTNFNNNVTCASSHVRVEKS